MHSLYSELASQGFRVIVVALRSLHPQRVSLGWKEPSPDRYEYILAKNSSDFFAMHMSLCGKSESVHFFQGIYGNKVIWSCIKDSRCLCRRKRTFIISEPPNLSGIIGFFRLILFRYRLGLLSKNCSSSLRLMTMGEDIFFWKKIVGKLNVSIVPFGYFHSYGDSKESSGVDSFYMSNSIGESSYLLDGVSMPRRFRIAFVGQLIKRKNILLLVSLLASLDQYFLEKVSFHIAGHGPLESTISRMLRRSGVEFIFHGSIPRSNIRAFFSQADLLVLPSSYDGWGMVAQEALLCGCRVIVSAMCGISAYTRNVNGSHIWSGTSASELKSLIISSLEAGSVSDEERICTIKDALSMFDPTIHARRLSEILLSL